MWLYIFFVLLGELMSLFLLQDSFFKIKLWNLFFLQIESIYQVRTQDPLLLQVYVSN